MPHKSKPGLLFTVCLIAAGFSATGAFSPAQKQPPSAQQPSSTAQAQPTSEPPEQQADEDLAPAAVQMDVSHDSPLIQLLYQATRETKEQPTLERLASAKALVEDADVKAVDVQGRTALHWAVFGSSYNTKQKIVVAYEEIADALLKRGVDLNHEDAYNNTALDYLIYSPNFEMQTLLIEHGATSGFLAGTFRPFNDESGDLSQPNAGTRFASAKAVLASGQTVSVRLDSAIYSDRSRTGDPIDATVTYPLCKDGEQVACKDGELLLAPGTRVIGTMLFAQKAPDKYSRPRVVLDFSNVVHKNGQRSPLYARVLNVDNARETVRNNEILGIVQPHATTKGSIVMAAIGASNPIAGYALKGMQAVYGLSIRREIAFPPGTDIQIQVVRPSILKQREPWEGWPQLNADAKLQALVAAAPLRTHDTKGRLSDLTNLMFLGTREQIVMAFGETRWFEADDLGMGSAFKTVQATVRQTGYSSAPVSLLMINGRPPDLVFQKSLDTFAKRHHLRIWKEASTYQGREVWIGAATHDLAVTSEKKGTKWSHRIDSHIDRERDWVQTDLLFTGTAVGYLDVERPSAPRKAANATGDDVTTDGKMTVLDLGPSKAQRAETPALTRRP